MARILFIRERIDDDCEISSLLKSEGHDTVSLPGSNIAPFKKQLFHCAVIDVLLDARGMKLAKIIRSINPQAGIILLLQPGSLPGKRVAALTNGADVCEAKSLQSATLLAYIASVMRRFTHTIWRLNLEASKLHAPDGSIGTLTARELAVLKLLACSAEQLGSRAAMANAVRTRSPAFDDRSIDQLVCRLRQKWLARTQHDLPLITEHGTGYRFSEKIHIL